MKRLSQWRIRVLFSGALCLGSLSLWGQGLNPPADTSESGATSGHGMTAIEQTYRGDIEQQIKALHEQGREAVLRGDAGFFEKHLADHYFGIGADGRLITKAEAIADFRSGNIRYASIDERDLRVDTYGDAAVVNSTASVKATIQGKPIRGDFRATFMYVKQGGDWKEAAFQSTPVAIAGP